MARLVATEDRLPDPTFARHSNRANAGSHSYRFGRISGRRTRSHAGRAVHGAKGFFSAMLKIIAAAKERRVERELRARGVRYDSLRLDEGDRFTRSAE
jgi:hypothetical protein